MYKLSRRIVYLIFCFLCLMNLSGNNKVYPFIPIALSLGIGLLIFWVDYKMLVFIKNLKDSLRTYMHACNMILLISNLILVNHLLNAVTYATQTNNSWQYRKPGDLNEELIFGLFLINALFFLIGYLWWAKQKRDLVDAQIKSIFQKTNGWPISNTDFVQKNILQYSILPTKIHISNASDRYFNAFPVLLNWPQTNLMYGCHYFHSTKKTGDTIIQSTDRTAVWYFPINLANQQIDVEKTDYNESQASSAEHHLFFTTIYALQQQFKLDKIEILDGYCLITKQFEGQLKTLGVHPIPLDTIVQICQLLSRICQDSASDSPD